MATAETPQAGGIVAFTRTVVSVVSAAAGVAAGVERAVVGPAKVRTARSNAWDAICADRDRARARAEMDVAVQALLRNGPRRKDNRKPSLV